MKKIKYLIVALFAAFTCLCGNAATASSEDVDNYIASIISYLKAEGYMPKIDSDGDVAFKHDGDSYWVQVSDYDDGYYVTVMTETSVKDRSLVKVRKAMDETARGLKFVRLYTHADESVVKVSCSWYCISVADFKRMFSNALTVVSTADSRFIKSIISD